MTALRVLMTLDAVGGVWRYAMDLARSLPDVEFRFVGFGPPPGERQRDEAPGPVEWLDLPPDWLADGPDAMAGVPAAIAEAARCHGADVIHVNAPSQAADLPAGIPVLAVSHSCVPTWFQAVRGEAPPPDWAWHRDINLRGMTRADLVVAPSHSHAAMMAQVYGPVPVVEVPNATAAKPSMTHGGSRVVASGRWWDQGKGGAVLDAAAARIGWPVTMLGPLEGANGEVFRPAYAHAPGFLPHQDAMQVMAEAGIFVSPSFYEPFGLAVAEAARAGLPLVLSDIPTFRELWDDVAIFVPAGDATALVEAVNRLSDDPHLCRRLGDAARQRSLAFTPEAQAQAMSAAYARLTEPETRAASR